MRNARSEAGNVTSSRRERLHSGECVLGVVHHHRLAVDLERVAQASDRVQQLRAVNDRLHLQERVALTHACQTESKIIIAKPIAQANPLFKETLGQEL